MTTDETYLEQQRGQETVAGPGRPDRSTVDPARSRRAAERRRPGAGVSRPGSGPDAGAKAPRARSGAPRQGVRAALVLVVTALVALGGGWAVTAATPATFRTVAKVLVLPAGDAAGSAATSASAVAVQVPTWAALAQTPAVLDPALEASGVDLASTAVVDHVSASPEPGTSIVTIEADAPSGREAAALASATAASLVEQIATRSTVGGTALVTGSVVEEPEVPASPASPDLLLNLAVALAVGLATGAAVLVAARAATLRRRDGRAGGDGGGEPPASAG